MIQLSIMDHDESFAAAIQMIIQQFEADTREEVSVHVLPWRGATLT